MPVENAEKHKNKSGVHLSTYNPRIKLWQRIIRHLKRGCLKERDYVKRLDSGVLAYDNGECSDLLFAKCGLWEWPRNIFG